MLTRITVTKDGQVIYQRDYDVQQPGDLDVAISDASKQARAAHGDAPLWGAEFKVDKVP